MYTSISPDSPAKKLLKALLAGATVYTLHVLQRRHIPQFKGQHALAAMKKCKENIAVPLKTSMNRRLSCCTTCVGQPRRGPRIVPTRFPRSSWLIRDGTRSLISPRLRRHSQQSCRPTPQSSPQQSPHIGAARDELSRSVTNAQPDRQAPPQREKRANNSVTIVPPPRAQIGDVENVY